MSTQHESTLDRTLAFTALLDIDPGFGKMEARAAEAVVTQLVADYRDQDERTSMWDFCRHWHEQRTDEIVRGAHG